MGNSSSLVGYIFNNTRCWCHPTSEGLYFESLWNEDTLFVTWAQVAEVEKGGEPHPMKQFELLHERAVEEWRFENLLKCAKEKDLGMLSAVSLNGDELSLAEAIVLAGTVHHAEDVWSPFQGDQDVWVSIVGGTIVLT